MTCYEQLRKKTQDKTIYDNLKTYFDAVEQNKLDEYRQNKNKEKLL